MSEFDVSLEELERPEFISVTELEDTVVAKVIDIEQRNNKFNRPVIRFTIEILNGDYKGARSVISYPRSTWPELARILKKMNFSKLSEVKGKVFTFKKMQIGRVINQRYVPVERVKAR